MTPITQQLIKKPAFRGLSLIHNCSHLVIDSVDSGNPENDLTPVILLLKILPIFPLRVQGAEKGMQILLSNSKVMPSRTL